MLLSPLIGALINGLNFRSGKARLAGNIGSLAALVSFSMAACLVGHLLVLPEDQRVFHFEFFKWIEVGDLKARAAFLLDPLSAIMILIITGVGTLIHVFSIGYMAHDLRPAKYFAYLNFFLFNMLLLVLGDNLLVMFVGWEGVGLCSYLLIGFWFSDKAKAAAGMKAFITNRIGDAGFLLGIFILFYNFGTVDFLDLAARMPATPEATWLGPITLACLCLFIGATGKSAQIPLYVWLPDAMAGPTPVSALIHAATMVTAGVYMIVRLGTVFLVAPHAMEVIAVVGASTALMAALIGVTQFDIKKVLAYSTVSQLGYMFLAVGVGAFGSAIFHLMTHAFFKALMFLGSGSVIHAMHEEQDIRKMGGLKKHLPITYFTFFIGWVAIIGIPPFAGFFSKDEILWQAFSSPRGHWLLWLVGVVAAGLTAFYMTRLMALVFWGKSRVSSDKHPHESPWLMTFPLIALALLSTIGGWFGIPHVISEILPGHPANFLEEWLKPAIVHLPSEAHASALLEWALMGLSVAVAGLAAVFAFDTYVRKTGRAEAMALRLGPVYRAVQGKFFVDEFYFSGFINPLIRASRALWVYIDVNFIDRVTYLVSAGVREISRGLRRLQGGNLQQYALYIVLGLVVTITFVFLG